MLPSVANVLEMPEVRRGNPIVLAGKGSLDRAVRWVHVSELVDIGSMLAGGEVLLTTGVALPRAPQELQRYVHSLADAGVAALFVGLGKGFDRCPDAIIEAAEECELPLIELRATIAFITVTEAVHSLIVNRHMIELKRTERTHETFTTLELEGASLQTILREAALLAQAPIVLENLNHRVMAYDTAGRFTEDVLFSWEDRSRTCPNSGRTSVHEEMGWIATWVGARGETWGRLVALVGNKATPQQRIVIERAASAIAIHRLMERDVEGIELQARRLLLTDIIERGYTSPSDLLTRAAAVGLHVRNRWMIPVAVRCHRADEGVRAPRRESVRAVERAVASYRDSVLVAATSRDTIALLVTLDRDQPHEPLLRDLAIAIRNALSSLTPAQSAVIGVGTEVRDFGDVARGILEACEVADAGLESGGGQAYFQLPDVHIRGLLHLLRTDGRVQTFVEREIGALLALDPERRQDLLRTLRTYLNVGRNKSLAADELHMSRPALYHRLRTVESMLGVDLDDVETCLSLHVAVMALDEQEPMSGL